MQKYKPKNIRNATSDRGEVLVYGGRGRDYIQYIAQPKVRKAYICHEEKVKTEYKTENVNH